MIKHSILIDCKDFEYIKTATTYIANNVTIENLSCKKNTKNLLKMQNMRIDYQYQTNNASVVKIKIVIKELMDIICCKGNFNIA